MKVGDEKDFLTSSHAFEGISAFPGKGCRARGAKFRWVAAGVAVPPWAGAPLGLIMLLVMGSTRGVRSGSGRPSDMPLQDAQSLPRTHPTV
jgi:hypothetical protein